MMTTLAAVWLAATPYQLVFSSDPAAACGTQASFERAVAERLGYSPFGEGGPVRMSVSFRQEKTQRVAELKVSDEKGEARGERSLTSRAADCGELVLATALAAALAVDPLLLTRPAEPRPPLSPPPPPPPPPPPADSQVALVEPIEPRTPVIPVEPMDGGAPLPRPPDPVAVPSPTRLPLPAPPKPEPKSTSRTMASLGVGATFNQLPTVMAQVAGDFAWETKWVGLGARVTFALPSRLELALGSLNTTAVKFGGLVCVGRRFGACFIAQVGVLSGWAADLPQPRSSNTVTASLGLQPYFDVWFADAWRLRAQLAAEAQPAVTVFYLKSQDVWRTPVLSFFAMLSIGYRPGGL